MTPNPLAFAVIALAPVLAGPVAAAPREEPAPAPPVATYVAHDGDAVVVVDSAAGRIVLYRVLGNDLELAEVRDLAADLAAGERREEKVEATPVPGGDAVGEDPPGFVRPPEAVRMSSVFSTERGAAEYWSSSYLARGNVESVWESLRGLFPGWGVVESGVEPRSAAPRASLTIAKGGDRLVMRLSGDSSTPEGWVRLSVELWRTAPAGGQR